MSEKQHFGYSTPYPRCLQVGDARTKSSGAEEPESLQILLMQSVSVDADDDLGFQDSNDGRSADKGLAKG